MRLKSMRLAAFVVMLGLIVPACAGPTSSTGSFAPSSPVQQTHKQHVGLKIKIPRRRHQGHFVSPATTQLVVDVETGCPTNCTNYSDYPITAALTPTSNGCTSTLASTLCTLSLVLPVGAYTIALTAEDAQGSALSTAQMIAFTVIAGASNDLSVTLSGIPHSISATWLGGNSGSVLIETLDVDGNIIVGPGSPTFAVASTGGIPLTLIQPATTSPNIFLVDPSGVGSATVGVTASYPNGTTDGCAQPGAQCTASFSLTFTNQPGQMFVANGITSSIFVFNPPYASAAARTRSLLSTSPDGIGFDSNNDLFVAVLGNHCVYEYAWPYTGSPIVSNCANFTGPAGVAVDSLGNLFISDINANKVWKLVPPYSGAPTAVVSGLDQPYGIALDASNNLYVANKNANDLNEYLAPSYTSTAATLSGLNFPVGVAVNSSGGVLVSEETGKIELSSPFPAASTSVITGLGAPESMTFDASGNLYVAIGDGGVSEYNASYGLVSSTLAPGTNSSESVAFNLGYAITISQ
jgi:hypothetical protein